MTANAPAATSQPYDHQPLSELSFPVHECRLCHRTNLEVFLDLGLTPLADEFRLPADSARPQAYFPLEVLNCADCGHVQLSVVVDPRVLYQNDYPYESSTTVAGRQHFAALARSVVDQFGLGPHELAVDVGSNVGVLVRGFLSAGVRGVGVEPAPNIAAIARESGIETVGEFFGPHAVESILSTYGKARVVTATNVFAHVHDLDGFMESIDRLLAPNGVFIVEAPHLLQLINQLEYDTIYHEHLSYLAIRPLSTFFTKHGIDLIDSVPVGIHGGSVRIFGARKGTYPVNPRVGSIIRKEDDAGLWNRSRLSKFATRVAGHRLELVDLLLNLKSKGHSIAGVSAPAKGMTLLNYCGIGSGILDYVTEKSGLKIGRVTPGGRLPVMPDVTLVERRTDFALLLAWNFAEEIIRNLAEYRSIGGKFIVPIPHPVVA